MKRQRQEQIKRIIAAKAVGTQKELADELARIGIPATQSSVSRDIVEMGLIKVSGNYTLPGVPLLPTAPSLQFDTAGENLIVVKTEIGQAQPVAVRIDSASVPQIVGTVAGDDTILIAVKNAANQRIVLGRLARMFAATPAVRPPARRHAPSARALTKSPRAR
jgi:transcriptional regulator of arginine metabolism